jgi:nicotinate-nucleotide adenylyltransferase
MSRGKQRRIGIYAGTFNPVHAGHIAFALQALQAAKLDKVYFLPERRPRHKQGLEHFAHRVAMLKNAIQPHPQFGVLELVDVNFSVERTLPQLKARFRGTQLVFLAGSDVALQLPEWPRAERLLNSSELVVGLRREDSREKLEQALQHWPAQPKALYVFTSYAPNISSKTVREALQLRKTAVGVLSSVRKYSNRHWLYVSLTSAVSRKES